jgi:tetratricopeptide (TPR) repeat protein
MAATDAEPAVKARLLGFLGDLKFITGIDYESAAGDLDESLRLYEQIGDDARAGAMHSRLGRHFSSFGGRMVDIDRALEHFRSAERLLSAGPPRAALGYTHAGFAAAALWGMRTTEGLEAADRAVDMARRLGNDQLLAHATMLRGWHLWSSGKPDEGVTLLERAYEAADGIGNASLAFFAAWMRGFTAAFMGDLIDGLSWLERELAKPRIAEAPNLRFSLEAQIGNASYFMGDVSVYRRLGDDFAAGTPAVAYYDGDWEEGRRRSRDNIANARRAGNSLEEFAQAGSLATSYYMTNELDRAEPLFLELSARDHRPFEVWSRHMLAAICCRTQRLDDAQEHLAWIRRIVGATQGWRAMTAQLAFAEAMCMAAGNRTQDAEHAFAEAVNTLRSHHIVWEHAMYLRDWARSRAANGDASGADEKLDEAAGVYRGIGANERWLHIVDSERP